MLSGNGRHRRPRQAPAILVAAGVTGSAIAIPLLGAASANAADGTTWDKVAECESGGSWSADSGNGYYGGLQMSQDDWDKYGGLEYASSPDEASRSQQIAVAEKVLADRGTKPWATCALLSGLTASSGSVDVDTGVSGSGSSGSSDSSSSSGSSVSSDSSDSPSKSDSSEEASPSTSADKDSEAKDNDKNEDKGEDSAKSDKSDSAGSGDSQGSGDAPTEAPKSGDSDNSWQNGGSWSLVDTGAVGGGRHRGTSADESTANGQDSASVGRHASRTYTVRDGDTLVSIADSLDVDGGWRALYAANKAAIGADPNDITAGQTLDVGTENGGK
ncbi:transglycosylase family protein [Streptomyces sp. NPDC047082]|uniref:transglycosylase family protein n=1 Tax=Streptomyces sp. NPDC047082 TaxID=3155259 RepID=UPI0033C03701